MVAAAKNETKLPSPDYEATEAMIRKVFEGESNESLVRVYHAAKSTMELSAMFCIAHELHLREMEAE